MKILLQITPFFGLRKFELQTLLVEKSVKFKVRIQLVEYEEVWIFLVENEEVWILLVNPPCGADRDPSLLSSAPVSVHKQANAFNSHLRHFLS